MTDRGKYDRDPAPEAPCAQCGRPKAEHRLANYADGAYIPIEPSIVTPILICPRSVYQPEK